MTLNVKAVAKQYGVPDTKLYEAWDAWMKAHDKFWPAPALMARALSNLAHNMYMVQSETKAKKEELRTAIIARWNQGDLMAAEVATLFGVTPSYVKNLLSRSRAKGVEVLRISSAEKGQRSSKASGGGAKLIAGLEAKLEQRRKQRE